MMPAWLSNRGDTRKCRLFLYLQPLKKGVGLFLGSLQISQIKSNIKLIAAHRSKSRGQLYRLALWAATTSSLRRGPPPLTAQRNGTFNSFGTKSTLLPE